MTNRQEVAKLLRKAGENASDWCDSADEAFEKVDTIIGTYDSCKYSDFFNRLADLIDPTCSVDVTEELETESLTRYTSECSSCGAVFGDFTTRQKARAAIHSAYCPCCGARVVRDEA